MLGEDPKRSTTLYFWYIGARSVRRTAEYIGKINRVKSPRCYKVRRPPRHKPMHYRRAGRVLTLACLQDTPTPGIRPPSQAREEIALLRALSSFPRWNPNDERRSVLYGNVCCERTNARVLISTNLTAIKDQPVAVRRSAKDLGSFAETSCTNISRIVWQTKQRRSRQTIIPLDLHIKSPFFITREKEINI